MAVPRVDWAERVGHRLAGLPGESTEMCARRVEDAEGERFLTWRRVAEWSLLPLAFVVLRFVPPRLSELGDFALLLLAAGLFSSPLVFSSYREYVKGHEASSAKLLAVEYRARLGLTLGEALTPIADLIGRIGTSEGEERVGLQGQLRQRAVDAAAALTGAERPRAVYFGFQGRKLHAVAWSGRPDPPNQILPRSGRAGELAYELVERRGRILVPDVAEPGTESLDLGGSYGTFLAVAVYAASTNFGVLTVDALEPATLEESDVEIAAATAQTLGAGLAL